MLTILKYLVENHNCISFFFSFQTYMEFQLQITAQYGFYISQDELVAFLHKIPTLEIEKHLQSFQSFIQIISHLANHIDFPFATSKYPNKNKLYLSYLPWLGSPQFKHIGKVFIGVCLNTFQMKQLLDPLYYQGDLPTNSNLHLHLPSLKIKQVNQFFERYFNPTLKYSPLIQKNILSFLDTPSIPKLYYFSHSDWPSHII